MNKLPSIERAKFPVSYTDAKKALAKCERVDECKGWSDKAAAMASYAKQADDKTLYNMAVRIRARAIRRCGDLLKQWDKSNGKGGRPKKPGHRDQVIKAANSITQAAKDAGLSDRQRKDALRLASMPENEFESAIESSDPPTVSELAKRTTKPRPKPEPLIDLEGRDPEEFALATRAQGMLRQFTEFIPKTDIAAILRGSFPREKRELQDRSTKIVDWCHMLMKSLEKERKDETERSRKRGTHSNRKSN